MVTEEELAKPVKQLDKEGREDGEEIEEWEDELEAEVETEVEVEVEAEIWMELYRQFDEDGWESVGKDGLEMKTKTWLEIKEDMLLDMQEMYSQLSDDGSEDEDLEDGDGNSSESAIEAGRSDLHQEIKVKAEPAAMLKPVKKISRSPVADTEPRAEPKAKTQQKIAHFWGAEKMACNNDSEVDLQHQIKPNAKSKAVKVNSKPIKNSKPKGIAKLKSKATTKIKTQGKPRAKAKAKTQDDKSQPSIEGFFERK